MNLDRTIPPEILELVTTGTKNILRLGQFISNFHRWLEDKKNKDPFYLENQAYCQLMKEYIDGQK